MQLRTLGATGLQVSALSFGASPLGGVFGDVEPAECTRAVHAALDAGINFFDVSPYYGHTRAESVLGQALKGIARDKYILATKVGRYGDTDFDFSTARVTRSLDESLARLGVDHVDLLQCHDIEFVPLQPIIHDTLPALRRLQEEGKARFVGITGFPLKTLRTVAQAVPVDTVLSYCHFTLQNTRLQSETHFYRERGVGLINASPLAMGLLTSQGAPDWHPADADIKAACRRAANFCAAQNLDIAQLALQFALANSDIATTLVGTASPETVRQNIAWIEQPLDQEVLAHVQNILAPVRDKVWPSGPPENQ